MLGNYLKAVFAYCAMCILMPQSSYGAIEQQSDTLDGQVRSWRLFIPASYSSDKPLPLLLNFHGTSSNPEIVTKLNEMEKLGEKHQFIVVAPKAEFSYKSGGPKTWNVEDMESPYNDINFVKQLIAKLSNEYAIDKRRIYATGFSGGARMSSKLACSMTDTFAAVAPVAGVRFAQSCSPSGAMPVITYHGKKDPINHYVLQDNSPVYWHEGVEPAVMKWVDNNQCQRNTESVLQPGITEITWSDCSNGANVVFIRSDNGGHTWPGSPQAEVLAEFGLGDTDNFNMSEIVWQFLENYSK